MDSMEKENSSYVFPTPITPNVPTQTTHNISSEDDGNITFGPHNEDERIKKVISDSHKETIYDSLKRGDTYPSYQFGEINEPKVNQEQNPSYTPPLGLYDEDVSTKEVRLITDNGIIELSPPVENANDANVINMEDYIKSHRTR